MPDPTVIKDENVLWTFEGEEVIEPDVALARLLMEGLLFPGNYMNGDWDERYTTMNVMCNDFFMWACSDSVPLPYKEIENLYRMWLELG